MGCWKFSAKPIYGLCLLLFKKQNVLYFVQCTEKGNVTDIFADETIYRFPWWLFVKGIKSGHLLIV